MILGYEYQKVSAFLLALALVNFNTLFQKRNQNKVVGWLVAIDNSNDTKTALGAGKHDRVLYAKLLREYVLPPSSSSRLVLSLKIGDKHFLKTCQLKHFVEFSETQRFCLPCTCLQF